MKELTIITPKKKTAHLFYGEDFSEDVEFIKGDKVFITDIDEYFAPEGTEANLLYFGNGGVEEIRVSFDMNDWKVVEK